MNGADQERRQELASLYALGVITGGEHAELQAELRAVPELAELLRGLCRTTVGLAQAMPLVDPPIALRSRVLTAVTGKRFGPVALAGDVSSTGVARRPVAREARAVRPGPAWLAAAAAAVLAIGAGGYALQLRTRVDNVEQRLAEADTRANRAEQDLVSLRGGMGEDETQTQTLRLEAAVFMAPDMNKVNLAGQPVAPTAAARAYWSRTQGVVFAATRLPALPTGKTYQLWFVPANAAPISAGLITPDAQGSATVHFPTPVGTQARIAALAVTLEPAGGVPAPTGDKYLVGTAGF